MKVLLAIVGAVFALGIVIYGSFAIYEGSWSLAGHNLKHSLALQQQNANGQASIAANGWNYQTMLGQEIVSGIDNVNHDTTSIDLYKEQGNTLEVTDETGQRAYDAGQVCYYASEVNSALPPSPNTTWIDQNCVISAGKASGVLSPSSIYYSTLS